MTRIALCFKGGVGKKSGKQYSPISELSQEKNYVDFKQAIESCSVTLRNFFPDSQIDSFVHCWNLDLKKDIHDVINSTGLNLKSTNFQSNLLMKDRLSQNVRRSRTLRVQSQKTNFFSRKLKLLLLEFFSLEYSREFAVYSQWYSQQKVLEDALNFSDSHSINYDYFIITRLDAFFYEQSYREPLKISHNINTIQVERSHMKCKSDGSCEHGDIFVVCDKKGAKSLSDMYAEFEAKAIWPRPHTSIHDCESVREGRVTLGNLSLATGMDVEIMRKVESLRDAQLENSQPTKNRRIESPSLFFIRIAKTLFDKVRKQIYNFIFMN